MAEVRISETPIRLARIGAVLALLASVLWIQWPIDFEKFNVFSILIFIGSALTWSSIELADYKAHPVNNGDIRDDVKKINTLLRIVNRHQYYVLKNKAIETYIPSEDYDGLLNLLSYRADDIFPFHHEVLQEKYLEFCCKSEEFLHELWDLYTSDGNGRASWRSPYEWWVPEEIYKRIQAQIAKLNRRVSELAKLWEEFIALARNECKTVADQITRYDSFDEEIGEKKG